MLALSSVTGIPHRIIINRFLYFLKLAVLILPDLKILFITALLVKLMFAPDPLSKN